MTINWMSLLVVIVNCIVALAVFSLRTSLKAELLQLRLTLDKELREEFATRESVDQLRERIDLSKQMADGFSGVHKVLAGEARLR